MVEQKAQATSLGRGFWIATAVMAVAAVAGAIYWVYAPIESWVPSIILTAHQVDVFFRFLAAVGTAIYVFVVGYIVYFTIVFGAKKTDPPDAIGVQIHDNHKLEFWWTFFPTLLVVIIAIVSYLIWAEIILKPASGVVVEAIGHQFNFTFRYPQINGEVTDEIHLPVNVPVTLNLTSSDVIHSFWVPAMRLKNDTIPGMVTAIKFTPYRTGRYPIICAQFCGTLHSTMNKQVLVVEDEASFNAWYHGMQLKNAHVSNALPSTSGTIALTGGDAAAGQALFSQKCSACHALGPFDQKIVGPGLRGVLHDPKHPTLVDGDPATPENAAKILQQGFTGPMGTMPNATTNGLSDKDIANVVAYLNSLK
ncbi:MAG: cytochrome c oxidase subunit II [Candidatus Eremiobacteraeota bacterium]|nr:cytochrome c oxidase subunit II [Candidatus Eremiobacteraeota bacterium]MBV8432866.1 cytochrome c oxidase subunit II [Candidatus Eremiobacteraeota bacterium]MBV8583268.1 cytochrome c oxidase subunit II [Candidatus Eremiobacteraeota bacterium]